MVTTTREWAAPNAITPAGAAAATGVICGQTTTGGRMTGGTTGPVGTTSTSGTPMTGTPTAGTATGTTMVSFVVCVLVCV